MKKEEVDAYDAVMRRPPPRKPRKPRTQAQIDQFKRFQAMGTLTAMQSQAERLLNEEVFQCTEHYRLRMIRRHCRGLLGILELS